MQKASSNETFKHIFLKHFKSSDSKDTIIMSFNVNNNRLLEKYIEIW